MKNIIKNVRKKWHNDIHTDIIELHDDIRNYVPGFHSIMQNIIQEIQNVNTTIELQNKNFVPYQKYDISCIVNGQKWFGRYSSYDAYINDKVIIDYIENINIEFDMSQRNTPAVIQAPLSSLGSSAKLRALGWAPQYSLEKSTARMIKAYGL